ncbi:MAG: AtpZ/AtpI family protein [Holosporales bacterium]|jgi:F0F1-type ATP synthase assembly protein I|nr:AtpZ/AtpI family protein [Holosporales bacterium]
MEKTIKPTQKQDLEVIEHKRRIKSTLINCGVEMFSCVLVGLMLGLFIDGRFGTKPIFIVTGFMLGTATAFYNIIKLVNK